MVAPANLTTVSSPNALTASPQVQPQFPPVSCCGRCLGQGQFPPKQPVRQTSFHAQAHFAKPIHRRDCEARCFVVTPEAGPWDYVHWCFRQLFEITTSLRQNEIFRG